MGDRRKTGVTADQQEIRDREVLRARREVAAYFKGQRTEREARAALKTIKAFVRDRERMNAKDRPSLPGVRRSMPSGAGHRTAQKPAAARRPRPKRKRERTAPNRAPSSIEPKVTLGASSQPRDLTSE